ncbi:glycoside hydrolase family 3 C-terminal domain-containing protein [Arthrobacter sp.]|uniref:glycoside hydrolase family 3 C-terminal domain-containing protein n=1 Tax=Arthrobacter sp. TaxID=1667 RepID=UPI002811355A|nr:glycoside hydrolase family 3 C-terminal domain-containing protein [Arthrobacter sp.]
MPITIDATTAATPEAMLARLTLEQKIALLHQHAPAVEALGLARFHTGAEAAHGVAWLGPATVFPQPVGLAASWDADLIRRVGTAVGMEVRGKKAEDPSVSVNVWAPVVNPLRHPLWGRNEEGFSEDPHLTAFLASAYCAGLKGEHERYWLTVPTLKHFLAYNNETDRNVTSSQLRQRVLHEYELPAFRGPIEDGVAGAAMLSYNLINGRPAHVSDLVAGELRQWRNGEDITVVTDAGAPSALYTAEKYFDDGPSAYAAALRAGVDNFTEDGDNPAPSLQHLREALDRRLVTEADIDRAVIRLLTLRERTGEFEPDGGPYGFVGSDKVGDPAHVELAREAAQKSVVLLRNEAGPGAEEAAGPLLPLGAEPGKIAVIGALGSTVLSDWYSGTLQDEVSIVEGLSKRYGNVVAEPGVDTVSLRCVRTGTYLGAGGPETALSAGATAPGPAETFLLKDWGGGECTLQFPATDKFVAATGYYLTASADRVGGWVVQETFRLHPNSDGSVSIQHIGTGKWVRIEAHTGSAALSAGTEETADRFTLRTVSSGQQAAREAASAADVAVVVVGNDPHLGGRETIDRTTLALPQEEQELIRLVREANPRTILVIVSSYPYSLGALTDTRAIVWTSHAGQELGNGLADVLSGDAEPSGRLPQTWWARDSDLPDILDYDLIASRGTYLYSDAEPLFPLGHGLDYSTVSYESAVRADDSLDVVLRNTGSRTAHELVQVYAASPGHRFDFPRRLLVAHRRVQLEPGERITVRITVPVDRLATYSVTAGRMLVEPGTYQLMVGPSANDLPVGVELTVTGEGSGPRARGTWIRAELFDDYSNLALVPESPLAGTAVAPASPAQSATAVYRGWQGLAPKGASFRLSTTGYCRIAVQLPGLGGTWRDCADAAIRPGFNGELRLEMAGHSAEFEAVRIVLKGPVTVSALHLDE